MFFYLDIEYFGKKLREIRDSLNISRAEVESKCGITVETLRKIEAGISVPRLDTIAILSSIYKYNLVDFLNKSNKSSKYYKVLEEIDDFILDEDFNILENISYKNYSKYFETLERLEDNTEKEQFKMFLNLFGKTYSKDKKDKVESLEFLIDILRINHEDYKIKDFKKYIYSFFELRLLIVIGVTYAEIQNYEFSNKILEYLEDYLVKKSSQISQIYYLKVLSNLSCNYHCLNNNKKALEVANRGIEYCFNIKSFYLLELFFYRKAIALYLMENKVYYDLFENTKQILKIQGRFNTLNNLRESIVRMYNIDF